VSPQRLWIADNLLGFYVENQGNCYWAASLRGQDPAVFWCQQDAAGRVHRVREAEKLSGFLLQMCFFEAVMGAPFGANGPVDGNSLAAVLPSLQPAMLGPWAWMDTRFYTRGEVLVLIDGGSTPWIWVAARSPESLSFLRDFHIPWEQYDS